MPAVNWSTIDLTKFDVIKIDVKAHKVRAHKVRAYTYYRAVTIKDPTAVKKKRARPKKHDKA